MRFLSAISSQVLPEIIHFFLRLAVHHKRDRFVKFKLRAAVSRDELLPFNFEFNCQH